jgi:hypothetical protein
VGAGRVDGFGEGGGGVGWFCGGIWFKKKKQKKKVASCFQREFLYLKFFVLFFN